MADDDVNYYEDPAAYNRRLAELDAEMNRAVDAAAPPTPITESDYLPSAGTDHLEIDPGIGTGYDFSSLFNTGIPAAGDLAKSIIEAATNKPSSGSSSAPSSPSPAAPPVQMTPTQAAPLASPGMSSGAQTALIVTGAVVGTGLVIGIVVFAARSRRRRSGGARL